MAQSKGIECHVHYNSDHQATIHVDAVPRVHVYSDEDQIVTLFVKEVI